MSCFRRSLSGFIGTAMLTLALPVEAQELGRLFFTPERRVLLEAEVLRGGQHVFSTVALNDVVVSRGEIGRMIEFELHVDGEFIYSQRSDGMIVATPTGSTAYALSANGPILHPRLAGIVLVPLCPHALSYRPLALAHDSEVSIIISKILL